LYNPDKDKDGYGAKGSVAQCLCKPTGIYTVFNNNQDCDDSNPKVKPGVKDTCATKGVDDDCDGKIDPVNSKGCVGYYYDWDGDGYGVGASKCLCGADKGSKFSALKSGDCGAQTVSVYPGAKETCNGVDDNCNKIKDEGAAKTCPVTAHAKAKCSNAHCMVDSCGAGWFDLDKLYGNGCECQSDGHGAKGASCGKAVWIGTATEGGKTLYASGNITPDKTTDWFFILAKDAPDGGCDKFNLDIRFVTNPNNQYVFTIYRGGCSGGAQMCKGDTVMNWKTNFYGKLHGPGVKANVVHGATTKSKVPNPGGECKCTTSSNPKYNGISVPGMNFCIDNTTNFYIGVYRKAGAKASCGHYKLRVQNAK
jgi:hypothetical protein